nr:MFS transporter [Solimonas marina]
MVVACSTAAQGVFGILQEAAKAELGMSDVQISLLQGLATSIPVAVLSLPLGRLTDRGNRMRLLIWMALTWTAGTLLTAFAQGFAMMFLARTLAGVGMMCALPVAISLAADLSAKDQRGRALLPLSVGKIVGAAAAFAVGGALLGQLATHTPSWLGSLSPWRGVNVLFAIGSSLLFIPLLLMREPVRHERDGLQSPDLRAALRAIWRRRALLLPLFIGQVTVIMADASAGIWASPVLIRDYGLKAEHFGGWLGAIVLLSGLLGSIFGGLCADFGQKGRIPGGLLLGAVLASLLSIPAAFFPVMPGVVGFAVLLSALLLAGAMTGLITAAAIAVYMPNELRGICLGAFIVVGAVFGFGVAPTAVTLVSRALGGEGYLRMGLTAITLSTSVIATFGFLSAMRTLRRDATAG